MVNDWPTYQTTAWIAYEFTCPRCGTVDTIYEVDLEEDANKFGYGVTHCEACGARLLLIPEEHE